MSASRRRRTNPSPPAVPAAETTASEGETTSWFEPVQSPPPTGGASPPALPPVGPAAASPAASPGTEEPAAAETTGGEPVAESRARGPRRRRRRPMRRSRRVALQLIAGVTLTGALLGVQGYDAFKRYESREPPPSVRTVPVGQSATLENARWRLVAIGPMPNPPENNRPERRWLQMTLEVTPLDKDGLQYGTRLQYGQANIDLDDGDGHTWRVEVLKAPKELRQGEPAELTLVGVAPTALSERVKPVLWPKGRPGTGPALRFDR